MINRQLQVLVILVLLAAMNHRQAAAAPDGEQLLRVCEHALLNEFTGIESSMCIWYITPCDCEMDPSQSTPRVCLPESVSNAQLALAVKQGLMAEPELQQQPAASAAALILARKYPCP